MADWYERQREEQRQQGRVPREEDLQPMPKSQARSLRGGKYDSNGISGNEGRARYTSILKWLNKHLFKVAGDQRTVALIAKRREFLSSLVNDMVTEKMNANVENLAGFWSRQAKQAARRPRNRQVPTEEDNFMAELSTQTFGQNFGAAVVVSDLSDVSTGGSSDSQNTL